MTAGSCNVAIRRRRPPQWAHANTSIANAPVHQGSSPAPGARTGALHPPSIATAQPEPRGTAGAVAPCPKSLVTGSNRVALSIANKQ
jgi:hypothetical protein